MQEGETQHIPIHVLKRHLLVRSTSKCVTYNSTSNLYMIVFVTNALPFPLVGQFAREAEARARLRGFCQVSLGVSGVRSGPVDQG